MPALNCDEVIERDANGAILKIGAEWNENTNLAGLLGCLMRLLLIFAAPFFLYFAYFSFSYASNPVEGFERGDSFFGNFMGILFGLPGLMCLWFLFFGLKQPKRSLLFHRDGRIETPLGMSQIKAVGFWRTNFNHANITQIEAVGQDQWWRVDFVYAKGDTVTVASALDREEARKVAIMLRDAWQAIGPI